MGFGTIVDPENGKTYNCALWLEEGNVKPGRIRLLLWRCLSL
jgi:uncharacterized protein (DUF2147 family)